MDDFERAIRREALGWVRRVSLFCALAFAGVGFYFALTGYVSLLVVCTFYSLVFFVMRWVAGR